MSKLLTFEVTLKGFDGGTDATDDKVLWVRAPDERTVREAYGDQLHTIEKFEDDVHVHPGDIDRVLP